MALHHGVGSAAAHEIAAVRPPGVVVLQPALELGVEVGEAGEVLAVEGRAVELLEGGALEALADRVVVGERGGMRWWRTPRTSRCSVKVLAVNSGPVSLSTPVSSAPIPARRSATWSTKAAASRADLSPATSSPIP